MSNSRICVTTDFSGESRLAYAPAAAAARAFSSELTLIHLAQVPPAMISPWPEVGPYFPPEDLFKEVTERLAELAKHDPAFQGLNVGSRLIHGDSIEALDDLVEEDKVDLLVVASHGFSGVKRFFLGSFAEKVLRTVRCPVLVVRGETRENYSPQRILVPHDFSAAGKPALALARKWALAFRAKVRLSFTVEEGASLREYASKMEGSYQEYLARVRSQAEERFRNMLRDEWKGLDAEAAVSAGDPAHEILREAKEIGADLIVLGTHGRSSLERFFLGSVTQKVVQQATCPVLAVRG